jgi:phenylalanyl-tRNA synthetase beta chain
MIVSWNWLTDYLKLDLPVEVVTDRLALTGLNHESTEEVGGDLAIDLEVTSNRSDCLGHIGVAREIGVIFDRPLRIPDPRPKASGPSVETITSVSVEDSGLCSRFTARVITGAKVKESPWWLRKRLETLGVRPVSNVVDVTNYVMFECGQPLHAYDIDRLDEHRLVVRRARAGESLTAINGKVYELKPEMLVIADALRPVGLAGVMGGLDTEIASHSTDLLIESARFDPVSVRRTSRALGLFSPSSFRFERPIDPEVTEWASRRCAEIILNLAGGNLHPGVIDVGERETPRPSVPLRLSRIERVLGIKIDRSDVLRIVQALGLELVEQSTESLTARPPSWRSDLEREIDLIEEVARIHGYEHIPMDRAVPLTSAARGPRERVETEVRDVLTATGFDECVSFSLVEESASIPIGLDTAAPALRVDHSSRKREIALRQSLIPSLLTIAGHNVAHGNPDAELFEIANVYLPREGKPLPDEPTRLALVSCRDFRGLKGIVEAIVARLHLPRSLVARPVVLPRFVPGRAAELLIGEARLGYLGELDRAFLSGFEVRGERSAAELEFDLLIDQAELVPQHRALPAFPAVVRDLSLVVERSLPWDALAKTATEAAGSLLESIAYLDTFQGGNIPESSQSVHFGLTFRHPERTLTGEEVERAVVKVVEACAGRFGAMLRS